MPTDAGAADGAGRFGVRLRELRERAGLTQQELAERAGLTPHAVSALERGVRTRPYPHTVRALASALEASDAERAGLLAAVPRRGAESATTGPESRAVTGTVVVPDTRLLGREDDVRRVVELVAEGARLVTLTGPGGVGKTRLGAAVTDALAERFADGVHRLSLAPLGDADAVPVGVARAVGLTGVDGPGLFDALVGHLAGQRRLLLLDNMEHLLTAAAFVARLVAASPGLVVLVTSRSPLRVRGEHEVAVAPLALPQAGAGSVEELAQAAAGALVLDRAAALAPGLVLDEPDVRACAELCHRLAGLPLAIELATAQLRLLSPAALLDRLDQAATATGSRDLPERQRTMRATLDWSYGLLTPAEQRLFTLLGAFRGGGTLEAVEYVATHAGEFDVEEVLPLLGRLVEQSLVTVRPGADGRQRFGMLEPVAQYARSLLVGDRAQRVARAHAAFFRELAAEAALGYEQADQVAWLARTEAEEANLLVAVERSLDSDDAVTAALVTWSMWLYWWLRGQFTVGRRLAERCLEHAELPGVVRARALLAAACMAYAGGDHPAAAAHWAAADDLAGELDDAEVRAKARAGTGLAALAAGDLADAGTRFEAALGFAAEADEAGGSWITSLVHVWLGTTLLLRGRPEDAVAAVGPGLLVSRRRGDRLTTYVALYNLAQAALALGDDAEARRHLAEGIELSEQTGDLANLAWFAETMAVVEARDGRPERVALLLGAALGLRERVGADVYGYYLPDEALRADAEQSAREALGEDAFDRAVTRGRGLAAADIVAAALRRDDATSDFR
jgi:predicted ATPase/transcriptional regulator with XRE-family HTH domain